MRDVKVANLKAGIDLLAQKGLDDIVKIHHGESWVEIEGRSWSLSIPTGDPDGRKIIYTEELRTEIVVGAGVQGK